MAIGWGAALSSHSHTAAMHGCLKSMPLSHPGGDRSSGNTKGGFLGQNCCLLRSAYFWSDIYPASGSMRQILPAIFTVLLASGFFFCQKYLACQH